MDYATVLSELNDEGVRTITLNRPDSLNAMNDALVRDVSRAFRDASGDAATNVIILTGAGRAFCAGDDRREHVHPETEAEAREFVEAIQDATRAIVLGNKAGRRRHQRLGGRWRFRVGYQLRFLDLGRERPGPFRGLAQSLRDRRGNGFVAGAGRAQHRSRDAVPW